MVIPAELCGQLATVPGVFGVFGVNPLLREGLLESQLARQLFADLPSPQLARAELDRMIAGASMGAIL